MGLKPCPDCGHRVSTRADSCPNCGKKVAASAGGCGKGCLAGVGLLFGLVLVSSMVTSFTESRSEQNQREAQLDQLRAIRELREELADSAPVVLPQAQALFDAGDFDGANERIERWSVIADHVELKAMRDSISRRRIASRPIPTQAPTPTPTASLGVWRTTVSTDEMTGKKSAYATTENVPPTESMSFPYQDVRAWVGFGCDASKEWVYVGFTEAPNLVNDETKDGYNSVRARVRWDDTLETATMTQTWGESFMHFSFDTWAVDNLLKSSTLLLELNWYGNGQTYFRFPLSGSTEAIRRARTSCGRGD